MKLTGWGRFPIIQTRGRSFDNQEALGDYLKSAEDCIAHGMGRSYGDSALNEQVIFTRRFNKILSFDPQTGTVVCESGVSLADLIDAFLPTHTPKPFGFHYINMNVIGQRKRKRALFIRPLRTVSGDTGFDLGGGGVFHLRPRAADLNLDEGITYRSSKTYLL